MIIKVYSYGCLQYFAAAKLGDIAKQQAQVSIPIVFGDEGREQVFYTKSKP